MAPRLASRVNRPRISRTPTTVSPYIVIRSAFASRFGWAASHLNNSANGPRACFKNPTDDHEADEILAMPS